MWNRHWHRLPGSFLRRFNRLAGCGGAVAAVVGIIVWWRYPDPFVGLAMAGTGGFFLALAVVVALFGAWPSQRIELGSALDRELTLAELPDLHPTLTVSAVVGPGAAGKTTLKDRLHIHWSNNRGASHTSNLRAFVVPLSNTPARHIVVLDGGGDNIPQQEVLIERAEVLIWIVDHNVLEGEPDIDLNRVNYHRFFLGQAESILRRRRTIVRYMMVLVNKRDLWQASPLRSAMDDLVRELQSLLDRWKGQFVSDVCIILHSNEIDEDIVKVRETLLQRAR